MPVVDVDPDELRRLADVPDLSEDQLLGDLFALGLEYEGRTEEDALQLEFAPDRLDRLSVEGVARSLRYQRGTDRGVHQPALNRSNWRLVVDESVPDERPHVTGAIVRDLEFTDDSLDSLIQLQEKLHETIGRRRVKAAIGIHDLTMLKGSDPTEAGAATVTYRGVGANDVRFVPLESDEEMTPAAVLEHHPTGRTYADIVSEYERMPAIYDDLGLFSFPPIINGRRTEVTSETREILIELTGTDQWTIDKALNIICYALDARGGTIESVDVAYQDHTLERPDFSVETKHVDHTQIESTLGVDLSGEEVIDLVERAGLDGTVIETEEGLEYAVDVPPYRVDVLHPVDLIDDIGRAYGFNELAPRYPDVSTVGGRHEASRFERAVRELLVGLEFEDLLNFYLISEEANFDRMGVSHDDGVYGSGTPATISEPYSEEYEIVRTWALPSLLLVLENNTHRAYPQRLSEIGLTAAVDRTQANKVDERRTVAAVIASHGASYEDAKSALAAVCRRMDVTLSTEPIEHPAFIKGRVATITVDNRSGGVIGEMHPKVLREHGLEVPVVAFELPLDLLGGAGEA